MAASNPRFQHDAQSGPEAPAAPLARANPGPRERFSAGFDRSFGRVYAYVSQRVRERESCERIVREVLVAHLDLVVNGGDETHELSRLAAASDRLIGSESTRLRNGSSTSPADAVEGTGDIACRVLLRSPSV